MMMTMVVVLMMMGLTTIAKTKVNKMFDCRDVEVLARESRALSPVFH